MSNRLLDEENLPVILKLSPFLFLEAQNVSPEVLTIF